MMLDSPVFPIDSKEIADKKLVYNTLEKLQKGNEVYLVLAINKLLPDLSESSIIKLSLGLRARTKK